MFMGVLTSQFSVRNSQKGSSKKADVHFLLFEFGRARLPHGGHLFQVERLYAQKEGGSIPQELCNGGIRGRGLGGMNPDEV